MSHEHATRGRAIVLQLPDGSRVLRLEALNTSNVPDLHFWLSDRSVVERPSGWTVFDDGAYVDLGRLKGNRGSQNYAIPAGVDLASLSSVSVWCARFRVSFRGRVTRVDRHHCALTARPRRRTQGFV